MFKPEIKKGKTEKNRSNKRRTGNSGFRSINNYQTLDKVPNDNLYNNDNLYSINKNFEFNETEEKSFRLFYHCHFRKSALKGLLILFYFRFLFGQINCFTDIFSINNIFNKKNLIHTISFLLSLLLSQDKYLKENKFNLFVFYILVMNQSIHVYKIYHEMDTKFEEFFILSSELIFNFLMFTFLCTNIKDFIIPQLIIQCVFFYTINKYRSISIILFGIPGTFFIFFIFIILKKNIRERWALFDSFKRSYYNMNQGLLEKDPNPIFILSKDKNILYRNTTASKLINNILEKQAPTKRLSRSNKDERFNTLNILEIIHPNLKEIFKKIITDAMEDDNFSSFNFPICKSSLQQDSNLDITNIFDIDNEKIYLNLIWFRILIYKIEWKGKDSFYMCCLPCDDVLLNEIIYKYTKRFTEKMDKMISNTDIICDALVNNVEKEENIHESESSSINSDNQNIESEEDEREEEEIEFDEKKENHKPKKGVHDLLIENSSNKELNNTILFFLKNQVELLYDYSLTCELYFNMLHKQRNFKYCSENTKPHLKRRIKIKELKSYYSEYFYDFIKEHKYKLEFKDDGENIYNIFIEEIYLRVILFNIVIFMICYLDSKEQSPIENKKEIIIRLIPEIKEETPVTPESKKNNDETDKLTPKISSDSDKNIKKGELSFIFETFSTKGDLNKIQELINKKNKNLSHIKAEILKLNYLDIGILTVNYLIENYYKTKMEMSNQEGEQTIKFKLPCELESINSSNNSQTYQNNLNSDSNSFFTSPLYFSKQTINRPNNFYNYNPSYNQKVMNMFYGIKKSPILSPSRHKRGILSFTHINEITSNRGFERNFTKKNTISGIKIQNKDSNNINVNNFEEPTNIFNEGKEDKHSQDDINRYSFKQMDFSFDSKNEKEATDNIINEKVSNKNIDGEKVPENKKTNKVLIFESQRNKDLITLLENENKGEYSLILKKEVNEAETEMKIEGKCEYEVVLINMGINKEIKFAEMICENKGKTLIYGYHFGTHTKSKEKNNAKFDKRFDLSFSSEGIVFTLKHVFINNKSIIK